jgi:hypothetical protein
VLDQRFRGLTELPLALRADPVNLPQLMSAGCPSQTRNTSDAELVNEPGGSPRTNAWNPEKLLKCPGILSDQRFLVIRVGGVNQIAQFPSQRLVCPGGIEVGGSMTAPRWHIQQTERGPTIRPNSIRVGAIQLELGGQLENFTRSFTISHKVIQN